MIIWLTGNTKAGKTTIANELITKMKHAILLDGDAMRRVWTDLGFSKHDRFQQGYRIARLAQLLNDQHFDVIVAVIAPYKELRRMINTVIGWRNIRWVYVCRDRDRVEVQNEPYEVPESPDCTVFPEREDVKVEVNRIIGILGRSA